MSFGGGGGSSGPSSGEIDAKARVKAAEEKARVLAEEEARSAAAGKAAIEDKINLTDAEVDKQARQASLLALSKDQEDDKKKSKSNTKVTLLGA